MAAQPVAKVTEVKVGVSVTGYGSEGDTEPLPMAIAARIVAIADTFDARVLIPRADQQWIQRPSPRSRRHSVRLWRSKPTGPPS